MVQMTYRDALKQALRDAMTEDDSVVVIGEEVGRYGGAYGVTKGLYEEFGAARMIDTPISEPAIIGAAVGAAMSGLRPVAELMYVDFIGMTMDQLGNQAAKIRYMFGGQIGVPMVLRTQGGTGRSAGAQHSQSLEAYVLHTPGLRLVMPARGKAAVRRTGDDLVIVTYSRQVHHALKAAEELSKQGLEATVIDLRCLNPLDFDTVREHVERIGRVMVVSEGVMTAGVGAELSARIHEECFDFLAEPVIRLCGEDIPISVSVDLEANSVPTSQAVQQVAARLLAERSAA